MAYGQMSWGQPVYGYMPQMQAMPDQLAQLRAQAQPPQMQAAQSGIIWVQGEAGAKSYLVAPGQHVQLMDSEAQVFYIKSTDASGVPLPLRIFDYKERTAAAVQQPVQAAETPNVDYVTRSEYDALAAKLADVAQKLSAMMSSAPAARTQTREGVRRNAKEDEIDA